MSLFAVEGPVCGRLLNFHDHRGRLALITACSRPKRHPWPCEPPPGTARALRNHLAGPPFGVHDEPRGLAYGRGWRSWDDDARHLPDHPACARTVEAYLPELGIRAALAIAQAQP